MKYILYIALSVLLFGCYNSRKAEKQIDKAYEKYPTVLASKARSVFPCITTSLDSSDLLRSKRENDSLFLLFDSVLNKKSFENEKLSNYLKGLQIDSISAQNCGELLKQSIEYTSDLESQIRDLSFINLKIRNVPAGKVIQKIEDSAKIFISQVLQKKAEDSLSFYKGKYQSEKESKEKLQSRIKGNVLVPWWVFVIIAIAIGIYFRKSIKTIFMKSVIATLGILCITSLTGCARFNDGQWVFGEALWIIPLATLLGGIAFLVIAFFKSRSGSTKQLKGVGTEQSKKNVSFWKISQTKYGIFLLVVTIAIIIYQNSQR